MHMGKLARQAQNERPRWFLGDRITQRGVLAVRIAQQPPANLNRRPEYPSLGMLANHFLDLESGMEFDKRLCQLNSGSEEFRLGGGQDTNFPGKTVKSFARVGAANGRQIENR